ncbi:MAG TPA: TfoX/Sxy family protein [Candidatus Limnocylindria bacterium]|jgi:TfoX/Sxy family transcriptional regulator of competence genes|nr:TfoX/Sxy family protein [Candidatus Limnocylindria bacterium]
MPHQGEWGKAPPELAERFSATVSPLPGAQVRKMFGYPAGFVNGHLFTGTFESSWFVRLPDDARSELAAAGGTEFSPMPGRPMREYLVMPPSLSGDAGAAEPWVRRALEYVSQLAPKPKR